MSSPPHGRRSRRLANQPPLSGELPQRRRRVQQNAKSRSLYAAGPGAGRSSSQVSAPEKSAASASENKPNPAAGGFYVPPTEPSATSPPENSPPPLDTGQTARSIIRDLHIFHSQATAVEIGGLHVTRGITNNLLYDMTALIIEPQSTWSLRDEQNQLVPRDDNQVLPGNYYLNSNGNYIIFSPQTLGRLVNR